MKTKEELNALKEEVEALNRKLRELTDEELAQVSGGVLPGGCLRGVPVMVVPGVEGATPLTAPGIG